MSRQHQFILPVLFLFGLSILITLSGSVAAFAQDDAASATSQTDAAATEASGDPNLVTYPENEEPNEVPGNNSVKPRPIPPAKKQALQRRAGEQIGNTPRGRAVVLGMHIQEVDYERAKVVEVAPASPAFDAGVRKGDEIVSFDGFKAATYREWIDGMRGLARDVPDGDTVPIVLKRGGKELALRLRIPVARAGVPPAAEDVTLNQTIVPNQGTPAAGVTPGQQPYLPSGVGYGGDTLIADALGDDFNNSTGANAGRALAEIVRLNVMPEPAPIAAPRQPGDTAATDDRVRAGAIRAINEGHGAGARVGIAGFRNDANGMFVIVDVGGLPPGNYLVGIDDPAILATGGETPDPMPNVRQNSGRLPISAPAARGGVSAPPVPPEQPLPNQRAPKRGESQNQNHPLPAGQQQSPTPRQRSQDPTGTESAPQSGLDAPKQLENIPTTILAQVSDSSSSGAAPAGATPSDGSPNTSSADPGRSATPPPPGIVRPSPPANTGNPPSASRTGAARDRRDLQLNPDATTNTAPQTAVPGTSVGPALQIGMITVDQSGSGQLQQVVEAVQVQDVVGQAIVIYAPNANPQATLPPNVNTEDRANVASRTAGASTVRSTQQPSQAADAAGLKSTTTQQRPANRAPANTANANPVGENTPVAGGVIQLMTQGVPDAAGTTAEQELQDIPSTTEAGSVPQNSAAPRTGQPTVR
jgi:hypothetical protein